MNCEKLFHEGVPDEGGKANEAALKDHCTDLVKVPEANIGLEPLRTQNPKV